MFIKDIHKASLHYNNTFHKNVAMLYVLLSMRLILFFRLKMNGEFIRYRGLVAVAVGAGVMLGAAGVFLYQQLFGEQKRLLLQQDINNLNLSVTEIRRELNALRLVIERYCN